MKSSFVLLSLVALLGVTFATTCDFNINTLADLNTVLGSQTWGPAVKTLCFGAGDFTPLTTITITAPQTWRGAKADTDPTCRRHPVPACTRLQSAQALDSTIESVFNLSSIALVESNVDFEFNGFAIRASNGLGLTDHPIFKYGAVSTLITIENSYIYADNVTIAKLYAGTLSNNYFESSGVALAGASVIGMDQMTVSNNFVTGFDFFLNANGLAEIAENTFIDNTLATLINSFSTIRDNFYLQNENAILDADSTGIASTITGNSFITTDKVYDAVHTSSSPVKFHDNCLLDYSVSIVNSAGNIDFAGSTIDNNYLGGHQLVLGGWLTGAEQHLLATPALLPLTVTAPAVCPRNLFTLNVVGNKPFYLGVHSYQLYWSFKFGSGLLKSGFDLSAFNGTTIHFRMYNGRNNHTENFQTLSITDTLNFDPYGLAMNTFEYTPDFDDFSTAPVHGVHNYYTLVAEFDFTHFTQIHHYFAVADLIIYNQMPTSCKDRSHQIVVPKSQQNSNGGLVTFSLSDLSCAVSTTDWQITNIAKQPAHGPQFSVASASSVSFTIDPTKSGDITFTFEITSQADSSITHKLLQQVQVTNTKPVAPSKNVTYTHWSDYDGDNILTLTGASDADGDTLTISKIEPRTNGTNIDDNTIYFSKGFVVQVSTAGVINLFNPDLSGGSPAKGTAIDGNAFNHHFGIHYQVNDGDRIHNTEWGLIVFKQSS
eukprot:TRINITY_DN5503_c0_g1_i1.p1 TRINITY_DN5503_c0_g1~~TRINITY_DN5503_c0_g1_i1.p1  ORF type:complete len:784 (-),score=170.09 TRINITY_DN5503_c0_g1_i1:110-2248(-)